VIKHGEQVFVDSGAWLALALREDPLNQRAKSELQALRRAGARLATSVPVVIETFTFLQRRYRPELAQSWREALARMKDLAVLDCAASDLSAAWPFLDRKDLHKLSLVDATSFALMTRRGIRVAFTFDTHFAAAGFRCVG
jgi:hypothetical protein